MSLKLDKETVYFLLRTEITWSGIRDKKDGDEIFILHENRENFCPGSVALRKISIVPPNVDKKVEQFLLRTLIIRNL